jgi:response regulator RpfG family c-di-GMP phosphodiesterase
MMICVISKSDEYSNFIQSERIYYQKKEFHYFQLDMLILPRKKGHKVLMKIKADNNLKKIPVIMLTTSSNSKDIYFTYENGCISYVKNCWRWKIF